MFAQHIAMSPHKAKKQVRISNVVMEEEFPRKRMDGEEGRTRRNALSAVDANRRLRQASKKEKAFRRSSSRILKVLVVGNASSGKSSLVRRYVHGDFGNIGPTIGADFQRKDVRYGETLYRLQLWDIAGQDRFVHLARAYFKEAAAAIVVCDASRISTILAAEKWLEEIENKVVKADVTVPIILAINKVDLLDSSTKDMILETVEALNKIQSFTKFHFTSAKTGQNVKDVVRSILSVIDKKRRVLKEKSKKKRQHKKKLSRREISRRQRRTAVVERIHSSTSILRPSVDKDQGGAISKSAHVLTVTNLEDEDVHDVEVLPSASSTVCENATFLDDDRVVLQSSTCSQGCGTLSSGCC